MGLEEYLWEFGEISGERIGIEGIKRFEETLSHSPRNESKISPKSKISPS